MIDGLKKLYDDYERATEAYNAIIDENNQNQNPQTLEIEITKEQEEKRKNAEFERKKKISLVLGHPLSFSHIRCWMVDVHGQEKCQTEGRPENPADDWDDSFCGAIVSEDLLEEVVDDATGERTHNYIQRSGALASEVRKVMSKYHLTDSGMGGCCWHLGCHCTHEEARDLMMELYARFGKALKSGMIYIDRHFWSIDLKD